MDLAMRLVLLRNKQGMDHELEPGNLLVLMPMLLGINIDMKGPGWNVKNTLNTWSPAYNFVGAARVTMCFSVNCLRPLQLHDATRAYAFATYASVYYSYAFFSFFGFLLIPGVESVDFGGGGSWHLEILEPWDNVGPDLEGSPEPLARDRSEEFLAP